MNENKIKKSLKFEKFLDFPSQNGALDPPQPTST